MIFIGYEQGTKGYHVYDIVARKVHINRDIVFDEASQWDWGEESSEISSDSGDFKVEYMVMSSRSKDGVPVGEGPEGPATPPGWAMGDDQEHGLPDQEIEGLEDNLDADQDDAPPPPPRLRSMDNITGQTALPRLALRNVEHG
jgi:hypothetical protein